MRLGQVLGIVVVGLLLLGVGPMVMGTSWEEWAEKHTYEVEIRETTVRAPDGMVAYVEITGDELKQRLGVDSIKLTKSYPLYSYSVYWGIGPRTRSYRTTITVTTSNDPFEWWTEYPYLPRWTWEKSGEVYVAVDPINLIWGSTKDRVKSVLSSNSWSDYTSYGGPQYIYDPEKGWMEADDMFKGFVFSEQTHVHLWTIYNGFVVGSVHREHWSWFSFLHPKQP